jgi:P4 family phage/plasmid primase-like protien
VTARAHLKAVFGDQTGWVFIGIGSGQYVTDSVKVDHKNWDEQSFRWPAQSDEIVTCITEATAAGADVYFTPSLSSNPVRKTTKNPKHSRKPLPVRVLWSDLDGDHDLERLFELYRHGGCWRTSSGSAPNRGHLWVPLIEPAEPAVAEDLLRRLAAWLGGDPAPTWHGSFLRPVGSKNWKPTALTGETPGNVRFDIEPCDAVWTIRDLDDLLPTVEQMAPIGAVPDAEPVDGDLPAELAEILAETVSADMDRSKRTMNAVGRCVRAGLTDGQIITAMRGHAPTVEKYDGRADAEVARVLGKVRAQELGSIDDGLATEERARLVDAAWAGAHNGVMTRCGDCGQEMQLADLDDHDERVHCRVLDALPDGHRATDVGNAARLLELADGNLRHAHTWGKWLVYRRGRWIIDENDVLVTEFAKRVARHLFKLTASVNDNKDLRERVWKWALRSETSGAIGAMIRLARGAPGILVEHEELDANPYLLNVRNGTIDLRTGKLRAADPADLITLQCPVIYDPDARAPIWKDCVERWQPDPTVRTYIQDRAGASATGTPTETVDVDYGTGANGKSKFWGAIQHVLGDYAVVPHKSLLVAQRHEQHATVVAKLFRKRLAVASETRAADVLDDEQVKSLTGGDRLSGRRMREDPWEFNPSHTLVMFSNHRPTIQGRDEGIWRRLRLVPWEVTIPEDERDDDLATKLRNEAPGILVWVVAGARRFITDGLTVPDAVRAATDRYRSDEDTVGRFVDEVLRIGSSWAWSADIRTELEAWCADQGVDPPPSMKDIADMLRSNGCHSERRTVSGRKGVIWQGVTIADTKVHHA